MMAIMVAERLRKRVGASPIELAAGIDCKATVSIGVAVFHEGDDLDRLLSRADEALYTAKNGGRDQVSSV
jgi:diguanylate cyclase (GGDEF)-like protein